eukprot:tig00021244_g19577.t1
MDGSVSRDDLAEIAKTPTFEHDEHVRRSVEVGDHGHATPRRVVELHMARGEDGKPLERLLSSPAESLIPLQPIGTRFSGRGRGRRILSISPTDCSEVSVDDLSAAASQRSVEQPRWFDFEAPTISDMQVVERVFGLHPVTTEDCFHSETSDRIDYFDEYVYVNFVGVRVEGALEEAANLSLVLLPDALLSFHQEPADFVPQVRERMRKYGRGAGRTLPPLDWIAYALLDAVVDQLAALVEEVAGEVETLDDMVLVLGEGDEGELLKRLSMARRRVTAFKALLLPKRDALASLGERAAGLGGLVGAGVAAYLEDVLDHVADGAAKLEACRETLAALQANYHARMNVEIARASFAMNKLMKATGVISIVLLWHILVTGLFAMNINIPFQTSDATFGDLSVFWGLVAEILASTLLLLFLFRRYRWI